MKYTQVAKLTPGGGEVLIRVMVASLEAFRYLDEGHARGKVVITVEPGK